MQFSNSVTLTFTLMSRSVWSLYTFSVRVTCKFLYIFVPVSTLLEYSNRCCRFFVLNRKKNCFLWFYSHTTTNMNINVLFRVRWAVFTTADPVRKVSTSLRRISYIRWAWTNIGFSLRWIWILLSSGVTMCRLLEVFQSFRRNLCSLSGYSCTIELILFKAILMSFHLCLDRPSRLFSQVFRLKRCIHFSSLPCVLHSRAIIFSFISL